MVKTPKHRATVAGDVIIFDSLAFQNRFWVADIRGDKFLGVWLYAGTFEPDTSRGSMLLPLKGVIETVRRA
jgi:hypothetical protein